MNLPYKYRIGTIEARNYILEEYQITLLGYYQLIKHHKSDVGFEIGRWELSNDTANLIITKNIELNDKENLVMQEICSVTKKRIENDIK
jgi:hypothetical protein